jgi:hypothetical protein
VPFMKSEPTAVGSTCGELPLIHVRWIRLLADTTELGNGESGSVVLSHRLSAFGRDFRRSA